MTLPASKLPNVMVAALVPHEVDGVSITDIEDTNDPKYQKALSDASVCFLIHDYRVVAAVCRADFYDSFFEAFSGLTIDDVGNSNKGNLLDNMDIKTSDSNFYDDFAVIWDYGTEDKDIDSALADFYSAMDMIDYETSYENLSDESYIEINPYGFNLLYKNVPVMRMRTPKLTDNNLNQLTICFPCNLQRISCPNEQIF